MSRQTGLRPAKPWRPKPWRPNAAGVIVYFRLTPKSSKECVDGLTDTADGPAFSACVRASPEDGAANAALERLVADWLGVPKRFVVLATGGKSRLKALAITGDPEALGQMLEAKTSGMNGETT